jgi:hypothetical protein
MLLGGLSRICLSPSLGFARYRTKGYRHQERGMQRTFGTILIGLLILNELRGLVVVSLVITSWFHGGGSLLD